MAAWQTAFYVIPKRALVDAPSPLTADLLNSVDWWADATLPADYRERLGAMAPPAAAVSPDVDAWGAEDGNRVEVWSRGGRPTSVRVRLDVRRLDSKFAAALMMFARIAGAALVRADGRVTEPTAGSFGAALRGSAAWRFVHDPRANPGRMRPDGAAEE